MSNAFEKHHGNSYWNLKWNAILRVIRGNRIYSSLKKKLKMKEKSRKYEKQKSKQNKADLR